MIGGAGKRSARMAVAALHPPVHVRQGSHPVACKAVVDRETTWKKCSIALWRFRAGRLRPSSASCRVATVEDRGERIGIGRDHRVRLIRRPSLHVQWLPVHLGTEPVVTRPQVVASGEPFRSSRREQGPEGVEERITASIPIWATRRIRGEQLARRPRCWSTGSAGSNDDTQDLRPLSRVRRIEEARVPGKWNDG